VNFLQALKFTEVGDRSEYLLKKYFVLGFTEVSDHPKEKIFFNCFYFTDYANRPFTAFTWFQKFDRQIGTEDGT